MTIGVSPNGKNTYESPSPANRVLVGTASGVFTFARSGPGDAWRDTDRTLEGNHISSILVEPTRGVIFAGTHEAGLWASEDDGDTWERRDAGIPYENFYGLNCNLVGDELRIYAGTEPAHLWVSTDLGKSWRDHPSLRDVPSVKDWSFPGPPHLGHVKTIAFDPNDPDTIYVGVEVGGAFKTSDGGKTWHELNSPDFDTDVHRLMIHPSRRNDLYMATGKGLFHSISGGERWDSITLPEARIGYPDALVMLPEQPDLMFTAGARLNPGAWRTTHAAFPRVARSRDAGSSWEYLEGGLPLEQRANIETITLDTYPGGFALFAGTTDGEVFFSDDEGEHWSTMAQGLPPIAKHGHISLNPEFRAAAHH
jgi:photosystem II stability/assembly factor-like uncharacterized protein